jgi:hypothetical protein
LLSDKRIQVIIDDPPPKKADENEQWHFDNRSYFKHYYGRIIDYIQHFQTSDQVERLPNAISGYYYAPLEPHFLLEGSYIGLPAKVVDSSSWFDEISLDSWEASSQVWPDGISLIGNLGMWKKVSQ